MGTVYQARDKLVGDVVALKTLELGKYASPDALERFSREVRLARRITPPHVARMHDLGTHEGHAFLTMEYVEGEELRALLARERTLPAARAAHIALAVCEGLAAAHSAGVVHRDLKPANVLVEAGGRVVLTDFGIARAVVGEVMAQTQDVVGTPLYMAPEQVSGEPVDARADLYAVGLLLFEMLTGRVPFLRGHPMGRRPGPPAPASAGLAARHPRAGSPRRGGAPLSGPRPGGAAGECGRGGLGTARLARRRGSAHALDGGTGWDAQPLVRVHAAREAGRGTPAAALPGLAGLRVPRRLADGGAHRPAVACSRAAGAGHRGDGALP
jgi:serine/threonine-protein kinase